MADRRRLVRIDYAGTVTIVRDLENASTIQSVRDSWKVTPGPRKPTMAASQRRYGGSRQTGETHDNGSVEWRILVNGATADAALASMEAILGDLESAALDLFLEWRPDGATYSTYYELRGVPTWSPLYEWAQFSGAKSWMTDVKLPVAPLARGDAYNIAIASTTLPATIALSTPITGDAPALADVSLTTSGGSAAPIWALIGWTRRPTTPLASSVAPWGIIEAEANPVVSVWTGVVQADASNTIIIETTTAGAGTAYAAWAVDPSTMASDAFSRGEITVEVWARIKIASTVVSPKLVLGLAPFAGSAFGATQYSAEFGTAGKLVTLPSAGTVRRFSKLGTLNMPVDPQQPLKHYLTVGASWAVGSTGPFGVDYLVLAPARQRALSPSSKINDATFPKFIGGIGATTKTIRSDLSGRVASGAGNPGRDSGLGGSLIELPPGNVDLVVKLSSLVPDDPTVDATSEQLSHTGVTGTVRVTPRYWLTRAA